MANKVAKKKTKKKAAKQVAESSDTQKDRNVVQRPAEILDAHGNVIDRINVPDPFDKLPDNADRVVIRRT